jgi:hypothetical protein
MNLLDMAIVSHAELCDRCKASHPTVVVQVNDTTAESGVSARLCWPCIDILIALGNCLTAVRTLAKAA